MIHPGILRIERLSVAYGDADRVTVRDVSLELRPGQIYGLIGPNGSGKTTLIRGLTGRARAVSGRISFDGADVLALSARERARIISIVPQSSGIPGGYSVFDVVAMGRTAYRGPFGQLAAADREKVESALRSTGVASLRDKDCAFLSGGEVQRVLIARAIAQDTPVIILDEPTAHLDFRYQIRLLDLVSSYSRDSGVAVLLILHDLNLAARYTDRTMILAQGSVVASGATSAVLEPERLSEVYRIPMERIERGSGKPVLFAPS